MGTIPSRCTTHIANGYSEAIWSRVDKDKDDSTKNANAIADGIEAKAGLDKHKTLAHDMGFHRIPPGEFKAYYTTDAYAGDVVHISIFYESNKDMKQGLVEIVTCRQRAADYSVKINDKHEYRHVKYGSLWQEE